MKIVIILKKIKKYYKIPFHQKLVIIKTYLLMGFVRFLILFIPFKRVASIMGKPMSESPEEVEPSMLITAKKIAWYVKKLSQYTFWESKCLVQALTTLILLKRRKIPCTLYLGMAKDENNKISAHAWLRCGNEVVTGAYERSGFSMVAYFST